MTMNIKPLAHEGINKQRYQVLIFSCRVVAIASTYHKSIVTIIVMLDLDITSRDNTNNLFSRRRYCPLFALHI